MTTRAESGSKALAQNPLRGRLLALVGIVLVALSLRSAIAAVSPIVIEINSDISIDSVRLGIIGMLPPICFAVCGLMVPFGIRLVGVEGMTLVAILAMVAGHLVRAGADDFTGFLSGSILAFAGTGWGNALLPPLVKRYFPDRIGSVTSFYVAALSISAFVPPLVAVPIANSSSSGWRLSLALWGLCAAIAVIPWIIVMVKAGTFRRRPEDARVRAARGERLALWRSTTAWAILVVFASSSMTMYAMFAWLPSLLMDASHVTPVAAGALLALYAAVGFPTSLIVPRIVARLSSAALPIVIGVLCVVAGLLGFVFAPRAMPWLWVTLVSMGRVLYPIAMTLINTRTRSHDESAQLSGFVNGVGYTLGVFGPLLFGILRDSGGGWTAPLIFLLIPAAAALVAAIPLSRPTMLGTAPGERRPPLHEVSEV
ncbi:MFS transporter [Microbacterium sp. STN6]|uniref:MFS transporter n=1 Tax=Microbacterium sp. STN6 TaxID=2995588 RepID=UPI002260EB2D|nr:MFS transporter [Microbacterium sp. STN6]MCX7522818.1 MFS transporter [Microbacterium sp. STN6]